MDSGKQLTALIGFIAAVKAKEKPMIVGVDYVVISRDAYDEAIRKAEVAGVNRCIRELELRVLPEVALPKLNIADR